jgi:hypothetical protein
MLALVSKVKSYISRAVPQILSKNSALNIDKMEQWGQRIFLIISTNENHAKARLIKRVKGDRNHKDSMLGFCSPVLASGWFIGYKLGVS